MSRSSEDVGSDHNGAFVCMTEPYLQDRSGDYLVIGNGADGFSLEEITAKLTGRIDENTRVDILAHGNIRDGDDGSKIHWVEGKPAQAIDTREVIGAIESSSDTAKNIRLALVMEVLQQRMLAFYRQDLYSHAMQVKIWRGGAVWESAKANMEYILAESPPLLEELMYSFGADIANDRRYAVVKADRSVEVAKYDMNLHDILSAENMADTVAMGCRKILGRMAPHTVDGILGRSATSLAEEATESLRKRIHEMNESGPAKGFLSRNAESMIKSALHYQIHRASKAVVKQAEYHLEALKREGEARGLFSLNKKEVQFLDNRNDSIIVKAVLYMNEAIAFNIKYQSIDEKAQENVRKFHCDLLDSLIEKGAGVNAQDPSYMTALLYAAARGDVEIARLLIEKGADFNVKNTDSNTPLKEALRSEQTEIVSSLVEKLLLFPLIA